jgi:multidrug resistance protein
VLVSVFAFIQPMTETMLAPCEEPITQSLNLTESYQWFLINSLVLVGVGLGPLILAPLSEVYGRKPVLLGGSIVFIVWNTSCGAVDDLDKMLAFRLLSGFGACVADAITGGVIADMWVREERGRVFAVFMAMPLIGPGLGPILGAFISQGTDWRWVFWITSAVAAAATGIAFFLLEEMYLPKIEQKWLKKQRKLAEKDTIEMLNTKIDHPQQDIESPDPIPGPRIPEHPQRRFLVLMRTNLQRPLRMLLTQPIVQLLALYMALLYGIMFLFIFAYPRLWTSPTSYNQSIRIGSLNYISIGIGLILGVNVAGQLGDRIYMRLTARNNGVAKPEFRLPIMVLGTALMPLGLLWWGWAGQRHTHWIVPNLGSVVLAMGVYICSASVNVYTIDVYNRYAASAVATNLVTRSMAGATFPLFAPYLFDDLGFGRGATVLAGAFFAVGMLTVAVLWWYGEAIRKRSRYCADEELEQDREI